MIFRQRLLTGPSVLKTTASVCTSLLLASVVLLFGTVQTSQARILIEDSLGSTTTSQASADAPTAASTRAIPSSRGGARSASPDISTPQKFITVVAEAAQDSQRTTRVPASVTIAQAILESNWGKSKLAVEAFNLFGIKAQRTPGPAGIVDIDTWEVLGGASTVVSAAFRAYHNIFESVEDHARFLSDNSRYALAFKAAADPREFARRIQSAGYATDPAYSSKLIKLMDKYNLYQYDLTNPLDPSMGGD